MDTNPKVQTSIDSHLVKSNAPPPTPLEPPPQISVTNSKRDRNVVRQVVLNDGSHSNAEKQARMAAKLIEDNTFTFKPKCSRNSLKIAQTLNTDFIARQQNHINKRQKYVSTFVSFI